MKPRRVGKIVVMALTIVGISLPSQLVAAAPTGPAVRVMDVALRDDGSLVGQVLDTQGIARVGVPVTLHSDEKQIATVVTDQNGMFAFGGLRGGVYQVATTEGHGIYRAWSPGTAPPSAKPGVLLVSGATTVRGQDGGQMNGLLTHPLVIGGFVAGAMAIPIIVTSATGHPASP